MKVGVEILPAQEQTEQARPKRERRTRSRRAGLKGEMALLEPQDEDAEPRKLYYDPLTFLSNIGSHSIEWPLDLWQTLGSQPDSKAKQTSG